MGFVNCFLSLLGVSPFILLYNLRAWPTPGRIFSLWPAPSSGAPWLGCTVLSVSPGQALTGASFPSRGGRNGPSFLFSTRWRMHMRGAGRGQAVGPAEGTQTPHSKGGHTHDSHVLAWLFLSLGMNYIS